MSWVYVAVAAVTVTTKVVQGRQANKAKQAEAKQLEENAKLAQLSSEQSAEERQQDLNSTLSTIRAIRTSRDLDPASPTGMAINDRVTKETAAGMGVDRLNALKEARGLYGAASTARARGRASLLSGYLEGGSAALSAYQKTQGTK